MDWIRRHSRLLLVAVIALGIATAALLRMQRPVVEVARAVVGPVQHSIVVSGRVEARHRVEIGSVITGRVKDVLVVEGAVVKAGQPLILLEDDELGASAAQARAAEASARARLATVSELNLPQSNDAVVQAQAQYRFAEQEYRRNRELHAKGFISEARLQDAERQLAVAKSQLDAARTLASAQKATGVQVREAAARLREAAAARELAEARLAQATLRASVPGTVLVRDAEPGDVVNPGKRLLVLNSSGETRLTAQIDEKNLPFLRIGQQALVSSDAFPDSTFRATLYYVSPGVDVARGSVEARFRVPEPPDYLRADMTVSIHIEVAKKARALTVPAEAVRESSATRSVQVVRDGRATSVAVRTGVRTTARAEIVSGINEGELVVLTRGISDGTRVRLKEVTR